MYEPLVLETYERLADGRTREVELLHEAVDGELLAWPEVGDDDLGADDVVCLSGQALCLARHMPRLPSGRTDNCYNTSPFSGQMQDVPCTKGREVLAASVDSMRTRCVRGAHGRTKNTESFRSVANQAVRGKGVQCETVLT